MKLLLCISSLNDIQDVVEHFSLSFNEHPNLKFVHSAKALHHEVDIVETGVGIFQTSYKVTKALSLQKYHLALKVGFGNSYKEETAIGTILNIINEKPGDTGLTADGGWKDIYDLGLLTREDPPQQWGGFVNRNNAYMNVFLPFKKAVGLTVNHYADINSVTIRRDKYKADCETGDGLGFVYPCLYEKQSFYQLCVIERNLVTGEEDIPLARQKMNETLIDLLNKL